MYVSTPLPLLDLLTLWNHMEGSVPPFFNLRSKYMSKYKEIFETAILVSVFVISVLAIGPIA
jgi:hypothetical protein